MYPRSGFGYRGTSAKTTLLETTPLSCDSKLRTPDQALKRGKNRKNFARNPPPRPPLQETPDPSNSLFGASFPSKEKRLNINNWRGFRGPKILYAETLHVLYLHVNLRKRLIRLIF